MVHSKYRWTNEGHKPTYLINIGSWTSQATKHEFIISYMSDGIKSS